MDTGAYGSYPKRKRYNIGRYISRKYNGRRAPYRNRVNPVNQYTFRKTRVGKYTKTDMQTLKCTYEDSVYLPAGTGTYNWASTANQYLNLKDLLQISTEFVSRLTQYSYYMISGISSSFTRRWIDPVAYGVNGVSAGFTVGTYSNGLNKAAFNFYPNLTSTNVGSSVALADSSFDVSPFITTKQTHYQPFPKNFTTGTNSNGLGVWNACSQINNLSGEIAVYSQTNMMPSDVASIIIWDVEINVYVSFCNNTGT